MDAEIEGLKIYDIGSGGSLHYIYLEASDSEKWKSSDKKEIKKNSNYNIELETIYEITKKKLKISYKNY